MEATGNFGTGFMAGYGFVTDQQTKAAAQDRLKVTQGREDEAYTKKIGLDKIQAVRYAVAATPPGEDPMKNLTADQAALVMQDPDVRAMVQSPELRAQRAANLALIDQGFQEYHAAVTAGQQAANIPAQPETTTVSGSSTVKVKGGAPIVNTATMTARGAAPAQIPTEQITDQQVVSDPDLPGQQPAQGTAQAQPAAGVQYASINPDSISDASQMGTASPLDQGQASHPRQGGAQQPPQGAAGSPAALSPLQKMIKGAQGEWGAQLQKGTDQYGADINEVKKQFPSLKADDGTPVGTKVINGIHPSEDGKSLAFDLKVTTVQRDDKGNVVLGQDGQPNIIQYTAPATEGRDNSPDAPVIFHPVSVLAHDLQMRERLLSFADARATELGSDAPIKQQQAIELVRAQKSAEMDLKKYENELAMVKYKFENGLITEKEMKLESAKAASKINEIQEQSKRDIVKEQQIGKNQKEVAGITAAGHVKAAKVYAQSRTDVANIGAASKKAVADAKAQVGSGDAKTNYPQIKATLTAKLLAAGEQIQGPSGQMLNPSDAGYNDAVTAYVDKTVEGWRPKPKGPPAAAAQAIAAPATRTPAKPAPAKAPTKPAPAPAAGLSARAKAVANKY